MTTAMRPNEAEKAPGYIRVLLKTRHDGEWVYYVPADAFTTGAGSHQLRLSEALAHIDRSGGSTAVLSASWFSDEQYVQRSWDGA